MEKYELVKTIKNAILSGAKVVYHRGNSYTLPEGQKSGTYFQQHTYAMLKAEEIVQ